MTTVTVQDRFDHPIDEVWPLIADFGGIAKYMRGIDSCTTEGEGLGTDRTIVLGDATVVERLTWLDHDRHALSYTILSGPLPFHRYVATMRLEPDGDGCAITWESTFEPANGATEEEAANTARGIYTGGIKGYKKHLGS